MNLTLDDVANLLDPDRPPRRKRRRRSLFTLRVRAGLDLVELARRGLSWARDRVDARRRRGTADDPRLEGTLTRGEGRP